MKTNSILVISCCVLTSVAALQVGLMMQKTGGVVAHASWKYQPRTIAAAEKDAKQIVQGRVINIERAKDICIKVEGEPKGRDCIPNEIVTVALEGSFKGESPQVVRVFHTGLSAISGKGRKIPARPKNNRHGEQPIKESKVNEPPFADRVTYSVHDDPRYRVGERYTLFLGTGPQVVSKSGKKVATMAPLHPALRIEMKGDRLQPVSTSVKLSKDLMNKPVAALTRSLPKFKAKPFKAQAAKLQELNLQGLKKANNVKEFNRLLKELPAERVQQLKLKPLR